MSLLGSITERERMKIIRSNIRKDMSILDLGCGDGRLVKELRADGFNVIGVDINIPLSELSNYLLKRSAYETGFADSSFDCIICVEVVEHLKPGVYGEIRRIGKSGSKLIITTPKKRWNWLIEMLSSLGLADPLVTPHINVVDPVDIPFRIEKSGSLLWLEWYGIYNIEK